MYDDKTLMISRRMEKNISLSLYLYTLTQQLNIHTGYSDRAAALLQCCCVPAGGRAASYRVSENIGHFVTTTSVSDTDTARWALLTTTGRHLLIFSARPSSAPLPEKMLTVSGVSSAQRRHRAAVMAGAAPALVGSWSATSYGVAQHCTHCTVHTRHPAPRYTLHRPRPRRGYAANNG